MVERLYNCSEEDETRIPLQKAIDDADYEHGHRVHELDFLTAFRSPRLRQPPKRLDKRVPQDGIGARLGHPRQPILPTAGPRGGAGCSGLSRAPEGRPRMPEPRPDPVLGLSLVEALRGLPEAPPGSSQAARAPV